MAAHANELDTLFRALANENRLQILQLLRSPHVTAELNISHAGANHDGATPRMISRQALCRHLDQLRAAGLVLRDPHSDPRQPSYVTSPSAMLKSVRLIYEALVAENAPARTAPLEVPRGPHVIVLDAPSGEYVVPLDPRHDSWTVGRLPEDDIPLDFDPTVQIRHAVLTRNRSDTHTDYGIETEAVLETAVNFVKVEPNRKTPIRHGDIVTIGGTRLAFRNP